MSPTEKWLKDYEKKLPLLAGPEELIQYFTASEVADQKLERLSIGSITLPSGQIIVRDLFFVSDDDKPYFTAAPTGEFEVTLAVIPEDDLDCARYAAALVSFTPQKPVRYVMALEGLEDLSKLSGGGYFGFTVDTGLACICDTVTHKAFLDFLTDWYQKNGDDGHLYDDYFESCFRQNYIDNPAHQSENGDWLNWPIPGTSYRIPIFTSGFGDGAYPVYFGYDAAGKICSLVIQFINIEEIKNINN
jgi:hypothetical protein